MNKEVFIEEVKKLGIDLTDEALKRLELYYELLINWNNKINLTTITEEKEVYLKHFYDSLTIAKVIDLSKEESLCDIGTGAGFPGIVLKICFPNLKVTLVDSLTKRTKFLQEVIKELELKDIEIINQRAEEYIKERREFFDVVVARAVAKLSILLEICSPFIKVNKFFVAYKGLLEEDTKKATTILSLTQLKKVSFLLPTDKSERTLYLFRKDFQTNKKFPRKYSDIKKSPL